MIPSSLLIFGRTGRVATQLQRLAPQARFLAHEQADLSDPEACVDVIMANASASVINAAAWTAVDKLTIVSDQIGGPTPAGAIADALTSDVSRANFACEIFRQAGFIPTLAYPTPAKRPKNLRLDCSSLSRFDLA